MNFKTDVRLMTFNFVHIACFTIHKYFSDMLYELLHYDLTFQIVIGTFFKCQYFAPTKTADRKAFLRF